MKALLNIAAERVADLGKWAECEAVRLTEQADGSLNLELTTDVAASRESQRQMDALFDRSGEAT